VAFAPSGSDSLNTRFLSLSDELLALQNTPYTKQVRSERAKEDNVLASHLSVEWCDKLSKLGIRLASWWLLTITSYSLFRFWIPLQKGDTAVFSLSQNSISVSLYDGWWKWGHARQDVGGSLTWGIPTTASINCNHFQRYFTPDTWDTVWIFPVCLQRPQHFWCVGPAILIFLKREECSEQEDKQEDTWYRLLGECSPTCCQIRTLFDVFSDFFSYSRKNFETRSDQPRYGARVYK